MNIRVLQGGDKMFGIFYMLFNAIFGTAAKIDEDIDNYNRRTKAIKNKDETYYDHNNQLRYTNNDRLVSIKTINHDRVIVDTLNSTIYKNISKEKEDIKKLDAVQKGYTVIKIGNEWKKLNYQDKLWYRCDSIPWYMDIKTDEYYIVVTINGINFYMNVDTGNIVRPADGENYKNKKYNLSVDKIIKVFNKRQEKIRNDKRFPKQWWWVKVHYYLNRMEIFIDDNLNIIEERMQYYE